MLRNIDVTQLKYGVRPPIVTSSRADTDTLEVRYLGHPIQTDVARDRWAPPEISYGELIAEFQSPANPTTVYPTKTYSWRNAFGTYPSGGSVTGQYMSIDHLLSLSDVYGADNGGYPTFAAFCAMPNSKIVLTSGGYTISILGSQILSGSRKYFASSIDYVGETVEFGLLMETIPPDPDEEDSVETYEISFCIGQLAYTEVNTPLFVTLEDGGSSVDFVQEPSAPQWGSFRAAVSANYNSVDDYYSSSLGSSPVDTPAVIRLGIDESDYLNGARIYYTVNTGASGTPTAPSPPVYTQPSSTIFNIPAAQYTHDGIYYTPVAASQIELTSGWIWISAIAYGPGALDSVVQNFIFTE